MLCQSCRRSFLAQVRSIHRRGVASVPASTSAAPKEPRPSTSGSVTPVTSSATPGKSQPLSTPFNPSTLVAKPAAANETKGLEKIKLQGTIAGGLELKGLAYLKAKPQILAKEDDEYPTWLWTMLDESADGSGGAAVDLAAMTKKQRQKYDRKQERLLKDIAKPIPVHEQSQDLTTPSDDAITSLHKRQEITKSSRVARRKDIRESNFLRGM